MPNDKKQQREDRRTKAQQVIRRIGLWAFAFLLFWTVSYGANNRIEVSEYTYRTDQLAYSFDGFRIVQLSDLHNKIFAQNNESLLNRVRELHPDMIVLTGDFIDASNHTDIDAALLFMQQIPQIAPTYYVTGNHEYMINKADLDDFLKKTADAGVHVMDNESVQIHSKTGQTFTLIGMDDNSLQANLLGTLAEESTDDFQVLLAHEPQFLQDCYAPTGVDLVFTGHAHGGQFRIPFLHQGLYAPDQGVMPDLTEGVIKEQDTTMYISRGLGNSGFPLRLFNHPEIVCVTLRTAPDSEQK